MDMDVSGIILANMDAAIHASMTKFAFSFSMDDRKLMEHLVVSFGTLRHGVRIQTRGPRISLDAVADFRPHHEFGVADSDGFGVDDRHSKQRFQLFRSDDIRIDFSTQRNNSLRALLDQLFSDGDRALDYDVMITR